MSFNVDKSCSLLSIHQLITQSSLSRRFSYLEFFFFGGGGLQQNSGCVHSCVMLRRGPLLSSLGVKHFNEQIVAGHVAIQVFVVKVFFGLQADGSDLWQPEEQLAKLVCLLRVVAHDVVQQRRVDLLLDAFYQVEVLQVLHIYKSKQIKG